MIMDDIHTLRSVFEHTPSSRRRNAGRSLKRCEKVHETNKSGMAYTRSGDEILGYLQHWLYKMAVNSTTELDGQSKCGPFAKSRGKRLLASSWLLYVRPSVRPSVCPSACSNSAPTGRIFIKFCTVGFYQNLSRKSKLD
jgi:hypothetical protein